MNLTRTEKYALAVLDTYGKLGALKKQERAICLAISCIWEMWQAGAVAMDKKGRLVVAAPLPESLSFCGPVYARLAKKARKPEKAAYYCIWTPKRIKMMVKSVTDALIEKSVLVLEQPNGLSKADRCHVDNGVIADDLAVIRQPDEAAAPEQLDLAALLLESRAAKKMLSKQERNALTKLLRQADSGFIEYLTKTMKLYWLDKTIAWACIGSSASGPLR